MDLNDRQTVQFLSRDFLRGKAGFFSFLLEPSQGDARQLQSFDIFEVVTQFASLSLNPLFLYKKNHAALFRRNCQSASGKVASHGTAPPDSRSMSMTSCAPSLCSQEMAFLR
jgi:hypothetical protein